MSRGDTWSVHTNSDQGAPWAARRPSRRPGHAEYISRPVAGTSPGEEVGTGHGARLLAMVAGMAAVAAAGTAGMEQQLAHAFPQPFPATSAQIFCRSPGSNFVSQLQQSQSVYTNIARKNIWELTEFLEEFRLRFRKLLQHCKINIHKHRNRK